MDRDGVSKSMAEQEKAKTVSKAGKKNQLKPATWQRLSFVAPILAYFLCWAFLWGLFIDLHPWWEPIIVAIGVHFYCRYRFKAGFSELQQPDILVYKLSKADVITVLKNTVPNFHIGDRWWILHHTNEADGEMKFRVNYEIPIPKQMPLKQQIVLDAYIQAIDDNQRVTLNLVYDTQLSPQAYETVIETIKVTTEAIDFQLKRKEERKDQ